RMRKWVLLIYGIITAFFPFTRTDVFLGGVHKYFWGYYPYRANYIYTVFMTLFMFLWFMCMVSLIRALITTSSDTKKKQLHIIFIAYLVLSIACTDFIAKYEISAYPWGYVPVAVFIFLVFYAIVRYGFLEIETVVHRTALWVLTSACMLVPLYVFWVVYLRADVPHNAAFLTGISFLLFGLFGVYKSRVQPFVDHVFRRRKYDYQTVLAQLSHKLGSNLDIDSIVAALREEFAESLYVRETHILMHKESGNVSQFEEVQSVDESSDSGSGSNRSFLLDEKHPICRWMEQRRRSFCIRAVQEGDLSPNELEEAVRFMRQFQIEALVPIVLDGEIAGLIGLEKRINLKPFSPRDLILLENIGQQIGVIVHNALHHRDVVEMERLDQELSLGREIQTGLLPETPPEVPGIQLAGLMVTAKEIGGDYYDYICNGQKESLRQTVAIGDVSGKGVGAGLLMVMAKTAINTVTAQEEEVTVVLRKANEILYRYMGNDKFMSLLLMQWKPSDRSLCYAGAGHEHIIHYHRNGMTRCPDPSIRRTLVKEHAEAFRCGGIVLGMMPDIGDFMEEHVLQVEPGDKMVLYTDGVTEACSPSGDMFGLERLLDVVEAYGTLSPSLLLDRLKSEIFGFMDHAPQHDDITLVVMGIQEEKQRPGFA
ncbi:MAG: SpoIIE family protein phosphatase, partial [Kiritimatiellae bacterium]|nr:SpoIIE family protein phosphatase [Kiritimatiellia bacterium]